MTIELSATDRAKFACAKGSIASIEDGMRVGLGSGSTANFMVKCLGERVKAEGLRLQAVPTSSRTAQLAKEVGINVVSLDEAGWLDLTIDGADEFDADFTLIKGGGGAHLQEKVVASASDRMIVITDPSKDVAQLGAFPLPVEVLQFGWKASQRMISGALAELGYANIEVSHRMAGDVPFVSDEGNFILDLHMGKIIDPDALSQSLNAIAGVVENGLFINICDTVVIGHADGRVERRGLNAPTEEFKIEFS